MVFWPPARTPLLSDSGYYRCECLNSGPFAYIGSFFRPFSLNCTLEGCAVQWADISRSWAGADLDWSNLTNSHVTISMGGVDFRIMKSVVVDIEESYSLCVRILWVQIPKGTVCRLRAFRWRPALTPARRQRLGDLGILATQLNLVSRL